MLILMEFTYPCVFAGGGHSHPGVQWHHWGDYGHLDTSTYINEYELYTFWLYLFLYNIITGVHFNPFPSFILPSRQKTTQYWNQWCRELKNQSRGPGHTQSQHRVTQKRVFSISYISVGHWKTEKNKFFVENNLLLKKRTKIKSQLLLHIFHWNRV